ncbi:hypothetical protein [Fictibacillus terranigra]|uniref:Uncharacterized protein n=1 Tax=Fictibacillus terranigra TaxID=3058424 RepID=A0ABT8ED76_9BACL|nr:hypothetical protein [Fictibacillus sp. CENA-BCM004]MDN4075893.1 hypothetical protein [Fictibacillus sp. CENA-BCM004]
MFIALIMTIFTTIIASFQLLFSGHGMAGVSLIGSGTVSAGTMYLYQKKSARRKKKKEETTFCDEVCNQIDCC